MTQPVGAEEQPVLSLVKVNLAVPPDRPVAKPPSVTPAIVGWLDTQCPPEDGDNCVVISSHIVVGPKMLTTGLLNTLMGLDGKELQPEIELVKINCAVPSAMAVTCPLFKMVATEAAVVDHEPPDEGVKLEVAPAHKVSFPVMLATGTS